MKHAQRAGAQFLLLAKPVLSLARLSVCVNVSESSIRILFSSSNEICILLSISTKELHRLYAWGIDQATESLRGELGLSVAPQRLLLVFASSPKSNGAGKLGGCEKIFLEGKRRSLRCLKAPRPHGPQGGATASPKNRAAQVVVP